jgi:hypothetical protein
MTEKIDFERASALLDLQQKAAANGALYTALMGEAGYELGLINEAAAKNVTARAAEAKAKEVAPPAELKGHPEVEKAEDKPKADPHVKEKSK